MLTKFIFHLIELFPYKHAWSKYNWNFVKYHTFLNSDSSSRYSVYEANTCIQFPNIDTRRLLLRSNTCKDIAEDIFSPITYYILCHDKCDPNKMSLLGKNFYVFVWQLNKRGLITFLPYFCKRDWTMASHNKVWVFSIVVWISTSLHPFLSGIKYNESIANWILL